MRPNSDSKLLRLLPASASALGLLLRLAR